MNSQSRTIGTFLVIFALILGGGQYYQSQKASTIYADETAPLIKLAASTHGKIAYPPAGKPTLTCFVEENMEIESVTAEIKTPGGFLGLGSETIEKISLTYKSKTGDIYKYQGTFTESLTENTEYKLIYKTTNKVGLTDIEETTLEFVEIAGNVKVNGVKVTSPTQIIYCSDLTLFIEVEITQGENSINDLALHLNGDKLQVFGAAARGRWVTTYELPEDGAYSFTVQALAEGGQSIQLASFSVDLGSSLNPYVLAGAAGLLLLVSGVIVYTKKQKESQK